MVALFGVALAGSMLTGLDQLVLLGELLRDEALSRRHACILLTSTPHEILATLGRVLQRANGLLLAVPLDRERHLLAPWLAARRFATHGMTRMAVGAN